METNPQNREKTERLRDFVELMEFLSIPRPNGSRAMQETAERLKNWLEQRGIPYRIHDYRLYPYFFEAIGVWLIISRSILALAYWQRWGWPTTIIALVALLGGTLDVAFGIPLVTWIGSVRGENILIEFESSEPEREVIFSAHYDSKTELLDHRQRYFLLKNLPTGIFLTLALGVLAPLDRALLDAGSPWAVHTYWAGVALSLPLLFLAWTLGLNLSTGRLLPPSSGAVDNGTSCAIILALAENLFHEGGQDQGSAKAKPLSPGPSSNGAGPPTRVTLALFSGEEANMQGSRAYVRSRDWPLPAVVMNLEVMAQNGTYVYWEQDGNSLHLKPTSEPVNQAVALAVRLVTGEPAVPGGPLNSDGGSFLLAGIPSTTLGTYHTQLKDKGFHCTNDNLERVAMERLPEGVTILEKFLSVV